MNERHVREVRATNEAKRDTSWCGQALYSTDWFFQDVDHAVLSLKYQGDVTPCPACLACVAAVIAIELTK